MNFFWGFLVAMGALYVAGNYGVMGIAVYLLALSVLIPAGSRSK